MDDIQIQRASEIAADGLLKIAVQAHHSNLPRHEVILAMRQYWQEMMEARKWTPEFIEAVFNQANCIVARRVDEFARRVVNTDNSSVH